MSASEKRDSARVGRSRLMLGVLLATLSPACEPVVPTSTAPLGDLGRSGAAVGEPVVLHFSASDTGGLDACGATADVGVPALRDLRFFVTDVRLGDARGGEHTLLIADDGAWQAQGVALVDLEDGRGACREGTPEVRRVVLTRAAPRGPPGGHLLPSPAGAERAGRTLRFRIGVPFAVNHADPARASGALALTSMHWSWRAGYKFLRLSATLEDGTPWFLHLGSTGCEGTIGAVSRCRHPSRPEVVLDEFDPVRDEVRFDPQSLFAALAAAPTDARAASCMGVPSAPGCAPVFPILGLDETGQATGAARLFRVVRRTAVAEIDAPVGRPGRGRPAEIIARDLRPRATSAAVAMLPSPEQGGTPGPPEDRAEVLSSPSPVVGGSVRTADSRTAVASLSAGATSWLLPLPAHIPLPRMPPASAARVMLGRHLFYDRRLSADATMSCATCHQQKRAFTDGRAHGVGITGEVHPRGAMSLANVAYVSRLTWANPHLDRLEDQARLPLFGEEPVEMGMAGRELEMLDRLRAEPRYPRLFAEAFPGAGDPVTLEHVLEAIAAFERTLLSVDAPLDRWLAGDRAALSPAAQRGYELFLSERLECFHCHGGPLFTDALTHAGLPSAEVAFHNNGLYDIDGRGAYPADNTGLLGITLDPADMGRFRAPTLRNIAVTAPYMHDGSIASLAEVIDHYAAGGRTIAGGPLAGIGATSPLKSEFVAGFVLTPEEQVDLLAFLDSLTDDTFLTDRRHADPWLAR